MPDRSTDEQRGITSLQRVYRRLRRGLRGKVDSELLTEIGLEHGRTRVTLLEEAAVERDVWFARLVLEQGECELPDVADEDRDLVHELAAASRVPGGYFSAGSAHVSTVRLAWPGSQARSP